MSRAESSPQGDPASTAPIARAPVPLLVAVSLTALESVVFLGYAVSLIPNLRSNRPEVGLTAIAFFVLWAGFLMLCAWQLQRRQSWARAPVVLAQLIQLMVGVSFWGGGTTWVAVVMIAVAVAVLVALLLPQSLAALET